LPANKRIGESWEIVDRLEAQSVVARGPLKGKTLHELWTKHRRPIFGNFPDAPRFPLLIKLLDAHEKLSVQVHPPAKVAKRLGGEPKTEFWYIAAADPGAELFLGFHHSITREQFESALRNGTVTDHVHTIRSHAGDTVFLPAGRVHAIGSGNLLIEIQQNSDTTYRVFDWNRAGNDGMPRQLHVNEALESINFADVRPELCKPKGESLLHHELFEIQRWGVDQPRKIGPLGEFAIVCCLTGKVSCAGVDLEPGGIFLVPAQLRDRELEPLVPATTVLRVTIPV
jgi:mannose-6-phosphate isomerase